MSKISEIINGWSNYFKGSNPVNLQTAKERAEQCSKCDEAKYGMHAGILPDVQIKEIQGHYCGICKCPLSPKVRSSDSNCPLNKW